ncbi:MAG: Trk family potassium uptake protein [Peptococcaceae bacterium]|jgi:trk system potassium uptake protein TrkH|nr:Trk family potassium uptake protein [Peptococcaceae bacterium]
MKIKLFRLNPVRIIILGFMLLILAGGILLALPVSSNSGQAVGFIDALYTSVCAVCVSGLVVVDTHTQWTLFGKIVLLILIQIGALGIMSLVTLFSMITRKQMGLRGRLMIQESTRDFSMKGIVNTFKIILGVTLGVEMIGACMLASRFIPLYGVWDGIGMSVFHAVSAFCNAGFDLFGTADAPFASLTPFQNQPFILLTVALLSLIGGLGFIVWMDLAGKRRLSKLNLHSKLVLITSGVLLAVGFLLFLLFEHDNPGTMGEMSWPLKLVHAFFQSAAPRSSGFNALATSELRDTSSFFLLLLMFIGGAPGSTAGGVKVTTLAVILLTMVSFVTGRDEVQVFDRRIGLRFIIRSITIFAVSFLVVIAGTLILLFNAEGSFLQVVFEVTSAFGTTGLSTGITPGLNTVSKCVLMVIMLIGRIGPFTAVLAFTSRYRKNNIYKYPEGDITVG